MFKNSGKKIMGFVKFVFYFSLVLVNELLTKEDYEATKDIWQKAVAGEGEYTAAELELPFRYEKDGGLTGELREGMVPEFDGCVKAMSCRARMDGERIGVDAELAVALRVTAPDQLTALSSVTFGEDVTRRRGEYVVCFPAADDTLWSVAKRYHAPLTALSAANGISMPENPDKPGSLEGAGYLIV